MILFTVSFAILLAGGVLPLFLVRRFVLMKGAAVVLLCAGSGLGLAGAVTRLVSPAGPGLASFHWLPGLDLRFGLDNLSCFFLVPIFLIALLGALYSLHYLTDPAKSVRVAAGYLFYSILTVSMVLVAASRNLVTFALAWELMSLSSFFLVIYDFQHQATRSAGYLYLLFAQAGAMLIFAAFGVIYAHTGSLDFAGLATLPAATKLLVFLLLFAGFGSKAGIFPLHVWLPHAHPAAPSHVSAIMSGVMIKMGIYGIIRFYLLLDSNSQAIAYTVLISGMITGVLGVVYALGQHDLKRLLAYHSVENIGIILIGVGIGMVGRATGNPAMAVLGFTGGLFHVLNHAIFKSLLFMGAGVVLKQTGSGAIEQMGGLLKRMKLTGAAFLTGSLAIAGLPPLNGFVSEFLIYNGGFRGLRLDGFPVIAAILAIVSLAVIGGLAAACFTKVIGVVFLGEPRGETAATAVEGRATMTGAMLPLVVLCLVIGLLPEIFVTLASRGATLLAAPDPAMLAGLSRLTANITTGGLLFFAVLAGLFIVRHFLYRGKPTGQAGTWGCGFSRPTARMQYTGSSYAAGIIGFYRAFAPVKEEYSGINNLFPATAAYHSQVEDIAEQGLLRWLARPLLRLATTLRWIQHGQIQLYIAYIVIAIGAMLWWLMG